MLRSIKTVTVTGTAAAVVLLPANPRRVAMVFGTNTGVASAIRFGEAPTSNLDGLIITNNNNGRVLTRDVVGDAICADVRWFGTVIAGTMFTCVEISESETK